MFFYAALCMSFMVIKRTVIGRLHSYRNVINHCIICSSEWCLKNLGLHMENSNYSKIYIPNSLAECEFVC